ncbi:M20 family metallopeptidase [Shouchella clausii]|uniref:M20 family metallopeptidase n=1 Tax=Shouchella clausii TaxID=79880 RepID=UPI000BA6D6E6|nr:M20 family metallopeptidase [Shouchella clausii]PAD13279.1 amidohydrolase [Shouchella clausii]PAD44380.1 amidohydrolase [Bacillus sp. 7520-S]PAE99036.1 amidohydrolase [Shouchella clausii]
MPTYTFTKQAIESAIDSQAEIFIRTSQQIHENPEIGNEEVFASSQLTELLTSAGFSVKLDVAGHKTGFFAEKGDPAGPTIAFLAEYDALPGIGHACGHNIIGTTSVAAAIALGEQLHESGGRVVVLGTPAEEGGDNGSAKGSFVREGLLAGIDAALMIHPSGETRVSGRSLAVDPVDYVFHGKPAHAAGAPEKGINALDGVIQLFNGINALRQHVTDDVRIHGIIPDGGDAANIVPDYARARFYIRANTRPKTDIIRQKIDAIAQGAALATGATLEIVEFQNKVDDLLPNDVLNERFVSIFKELGEDVQTDERDGLGSTDTGNISQVVPTIHPYIKIGPDDLVGHTVAFREAAASPQGNQALITGAKGLALIGFQLLTEPELLAKAKQEHAERKKAAALAVV